MVKLRVDRQQLARFIGDDLQTIRAFETLIADGGGVLSIDASGGTTGFTFTGGPVTDIGTLILEGTLNTSSGGTGATTPAGARESILPDYTGNAGKALVVNAGETDVEYADAPSFLGVTVKATDTARASTVTPTADLTIALAANTVYRFDYRLLYTATIGVGLKYRFGRTGLSDADLRFSVAPDRPDAETLTWAGETDCDGDGVRQSVGTGVIVTGAVSGSIVLEWSQVVSDVADTTLKAGSMITLTAVA